MMRFLTRWCSVGVLVCAAASPADAQLARRPQLQAVSQVASAAHGELHGVVEDDKGQALAGVVISALGSSTVFAVSDKDGRFGFRALPAGPYLVRAHLQGYVPAAARVVQITANSRSAYNLSLTRGQSSEAPTVLTAGVGGGDVSVPGGDNEHEHGEVAWRLRHAKRSVLKDAEQAIADLGDDDSLFGGSLEGLGRAVGSPARLASALFADLSLNGQINLLTTTSFDRPQDLFMMGADAPRGVAYMSLVAPGADGDWLVRGTVTQGDVASWILAGSYRRSADVTHAYEAGLSYSMQRYLGGNGEALLAMRDGSRNVGAIYAYDNWAISPRVRVGYGGQYARYDYLPDASLISPRASVTVQPWARDPLTLRTTISHRETAPGAEEFTPPTVGLWLPPERTFSQVSRSAFRPERLDHVEIAAERELGDALVVGVRAFRQRVDDQVVTLFGLSVADSRSGGGHYHVGSAGDFQARGWSVSASRSVGDGVRASVDYTQFDADWLAGSSDGEALALLAGSVLRRNERVHDMTASIESVIAPSSTRFFVLYKVNSGIAAAASDATASALRNGRFNVQVRQALPFLNFMSANWEMLVAVSNLFRDEMVDASVYDELLVVHPPKRVLGGVTVRF
jgi:hypothetical protein